MQQRLRNLRLMLANERRRKRAGKRGAALQTSAVEGRPALRLVAMSGGGQGAAPARRLPAALRLVWDLAANREMPRCSGTPPVGSPLRS